MKVEVAGASVELRDQDLLGVGGEARVYRHGDLAVKVYHPVDTGLPHDQKAQAEKALAMRFEKIRRFPARLPPRVVAPLDLATRNGRPVGYAMRLVTGAHDLMRLSQRTWREGVVPNSAVVALFRQIHADLVELHRRRVVVGDLNDANVVFTWPAAPGGVQPQTFLIDADSMQFDGFPCVVAHERFLDPRCYGKDLATGSPLDEETDWYAFAVLLFASLLYVHPYGGVHPRLPTLLRRAEARVSVLGSGVTLPRAAVSPQVLPEELERHFVEIFDRDRRGSFPESLLDISWTRCSCGLEHARQRCPDCARPGPAAIVAVTVSGRCRARRVFATRGAIAAVAAQGTLRYVYVEEGVARREDGSIVADLTSSAPARFAITRTSTWAARGTSLERVDPTGSTERTSTALFASQPVFDANSERAFRIQDGWLLDATLGTRLGQVLEGQTWFAVGERLGIGFYRAGLVTVYFLFRTDRAGFTHPRLPPIDGRLVDVHAAFDDHHALLVLATEKGGKKTHTMHLVSGSGKVEATVSGAPDQVRMVSGVRNKALFAGRVVVATDDGLLALAVDAPSGRLVEGRLFADTRPFVDQTAGILPGPGGSIYVVTTRDIVHLTLE